MIRPPIFIATLLLAGGVLAWLLLGTGGGPAVHAQKMQTDRKADAGERGRDGDEAKDAKDIDLETPQGVLARLMERPGAVVALTARGQSIEDAPPFEATLRIDFMEYHPCSDCHEGEIANRKARVLKDEHTELDFQHGAGRFWCYDACHNAGGMDKLRSARGELISFDESYKLCGQCHFKQQKDWYFGGHGKRAGSFEMPREIPLEYSEFDWSDREKIATWRTDKRMLHNCTDCHDAHNPSIKPYEPSPPPQVRAGLSRSEAESHRPKPIWEELSERLGGGESSHGGNR